jgi:hypothetical protein
MYTLVITLVLGCWCTFTRALQELARSSVADMAEKLGRTEAAWQEDIKEECVECGWYNKIIKTGFSTFYR